MRVACATNPVWLQAPMPSSTATTRTRRSAGQSRLLVEPRTGGFQLGGQPEERGLVAESPDQLNRERQTPGGSGSLDAPERERDRRLAGEVEPDGEWGERKYPPPILVHVLEHHVDPSELDRAGRGEPGCEEDVVPLVEGRHLATEAVGGLGRSDVIGGGDLLPARGGVERHVLDLVAAGWAAGGRVCPHVDRRVGGHDGHEGRNDRLALDLRICFHHPMPELGGERRDLVDELHARGINGGAIRRTNGPGDTQPAG